MTASCYAALEIVSVLIIIVTTLNSLSATSDPPHNHTLSSRQGHKETVHCSKV